MTYFKKISITLLLIVGLGLSGLRITAQAQYPGSPTSALSGSQKAVQPQLTDFNPTQDIAPIKTIFEQESRWLGGFPSTAFAEEREEKEEAWTKIKILKNNAALIGFIFYQLLDDTRGHIGYLAIRKEDQGKKYGQFLLENAIRELKESGVEKITLWTHPDNHNAQKLYKRMGFQERDVYGYMTLPCALV